MKANEQGAYVPAHTAMAKGMNTTQQATAELDDSWPAFPVQAGTSKGQEGMSLRDYFAAKAPPPPEWWGRYRKGFNSLTEEADHIASWNYEYADAMLKERAQ